MPPDSRRSMTRRVAAFTLAALCGFSTLVLTACGGGGDDDGKGSTTLRVLNASADLDSIDLVLVDSDSNETKPIAAVARDAQSSYVDVTAGTYTVRIKRAGASATLVATGPTFSKGERYTVYVFGREGDYRVGYDIDKEDEPSSGKAKLRIFNAAPDAGSLDVYLTEASATLDDTLPTIAATTGGRIGSWTPVDRGSWRVRVTGAGDKADLRLDLPELALADKARTTLVLQPGPGGVLVHALVSQYQGALTVQKNTQARVRLVAGGNANAAVTARVAGTSLNVNLRSPSVGAYTLVAAGTAGATIAVNATTSIGGSVTLLPGGDHTLAVYGDASAPTWKLLTDDNRPPSSSTRAKLRLVHLAPTSAEANLTLVLDYVGIANDVAYGQASAYALVTGTSGARLEVTSPLSATPLYLNDDASLPAGGVFTVFMLGGGSTPAGVLRRER